MIHPTAIVDPNAQVGKSVEIGAYALIGAGVRLGSGCKIGSHAQLCGMVEVGEETQIGRAAIIGSDPQDLSFDPTSKTGVRLGAKNIIRELTTIHRSACEGEWTEIGNENFLMAGTHVGHDVCMGNQNVIANNCLLAGHVVIGNNSFLGGGAAFHQFVHLGDLCLAQGNATITKDIPPYCVVYQRNRLIGLNVVGLRRAGIDSSFRAEIKRLYRGAFLSKLPLTAALENLQQEKWSPIALKLLKALQNPSRKGVCFPTPL